MSYNILPTPLFIKELKKLVKKYPSLKNEMEDIEEELNENLKLGTSIGNNCYKIRIAIKSKGKGKSGGARLITYFVYKPKDETLFLLSIYDKSEKENITDEHIRKLIEEITN